MHCTVPACQHPVTVREPLPLCELDAARVSIAYLQSQLAGPAPVQVQSPEVQAPPQMTEQQARGVIAAASDSTSVRDLATLTGWSIGWVHARRAELRVDG